MEKNIKWDSLWWKAKMPTSISSEVEQRNKGINTSQPRKPAAQGEWSSSGENLEQDLPDQRRRIRQIRRCIPRFRWTWRTSTSGSRWYDQASPDTIQKNIWGSPETAARTSKRVWATRHCRGGCGTTDWVHELNSSQQERQWENTILSWPTALNKALRRGFYMNFDSDGNCFIEEFESFKPT